MKPKGWMAATVIALLLAGLVILPACGSSSSPTAPTGIGVGKGIYRGQATDGDGNPIEGAFIHVQGSPEPGSSPDGGAAVTDVNGDFAVIVDETLYDPPYIITAQNEAGDVLWSDEIGDEALEPEEPEVPGDPEELYGDSNGIGKCVSTCVHIYNPSSTVDPEAVLPLMDGKFNASKCVSFCKDNGYRGEFPGDESCNPFYVGYPDCGVAAEPPGEEPPPEEPAEDAGAAEATNPEKPKSNNGNGNGQNS